MASVADECNRVSGQDLSEEEEAVRADLVRTPEDEELDKWKPFGVFEARRRFILEGLSNERWRGAFKQSRPVWRPQAFRVQN